MPRKPMMRNEVILTTGQIGTIRTMITYMLTEEDLGKIDDDFVDKLYDLENAFDKIASKIIN